MVIFYNTRMSPSYSSQSSTSTSLFKRLHWQMIMIPNIEIRGWRILPRSKQPSTIPYSFLLSSISLENLLKLTNFLHQGSWKIDFLTHAEIKREFGVCLYCALSVNIIVCLWQKFSITAFIVFSTRVLPTLPNVPRVCRLVWLTMYSGKRRSGCASLL